MNIKHIHSSSSPPPRKTKSTALNNAVNQASSWTSRSHWLMYQIRNLWKWTEIKSADSRLHKPALNHRLFVLGQCLKEVCSEQQGKTIPDLTLQQVLFAPLKRIGQLVICVPNTASPHWDFNYFFFLMCLTISLQLWEVQEMKMKNLSTKTIRFLN